MLLPISQFLSETRILRRRLLSSQARVIVRRGQLVDANDVIAESIVSNQHQLVDLARGLGLSPEQASRYIKCEVGDLLAAGDILAGPVGLARRVVRATQPGKVALLGKGQLLVEISGGEEFLYAGLSGEVVDLIPDRGALISAQGALIQGVWGNGKIGSGILQLANNQDDPLLTPSQIMEDARGAILVGECCMDAETLARVADAGVSGLILAGLNPELIPLVLSLRLPVILIEGFVGQVIGSSGNWVLPTINVVAREIIDACMGRVAAINAEPWVPPLDTRPELIIPKPTQSKPKVPADSDLLAPGMRVRLVRAPHLGQVGQLVDLPGVVRLPNGLRTESAQVQLDRGQLVLIPLLNLDLIS